MSPRTPPLVLVTDDDESVRDVTVVSLQMFAGWDVVVAAGGAEAVEAARREQPDVILMDLMMPGMDGRATVERLRADPATEGLSVIMLTARETDGDQRWQAPGVVGVLTKPFDPRTLAPRIAQLLGWPAEIARRED